MFEGKSYGLVMSSLRKAMDPVRAMKAVFVFANYGLIDHKHETGDGYEMRFELSVHSRGRP